MNIEDYICISKGNEINGVSLINKERLMGKDTRHPAGYQEESLLHFSDGSIIYFRDHTDNEPGWRGHDRYWKFKTKGSQVSKDSPEEAFSKMGNV